MQNTKLALAQLGARKHYQEPVLFHSWGFLDQFYTDFYSGDSPLTNLLRQKKVYPRIPNFIKKGLIKTGQKFL